MPVIPVARILSIHDNFETSTEATETDHSIEIEQSVLESTKSTEAAETDDDVEIEIEQRVHATTKSTEATETDNDKGIKQSVHETTICNMNNMIDNEGEENEMNDDK
jgi:alkyl sulfatase BDS1-like metallo-beta-lactamase superfamily hydrolase